MKVCVRCGIEKQLNSFPKDLRKPDGVTAACKDCENARNRRARALKNIETSKWWTFARFLGLSERAVLESRFWSNVAEEGDCWIWTGSKCGNDYGMFGYDQKVVRAHRFAYEWMIGEIPPDLTYDHLCRNRSCVNPYHAELVPLGVNVGRANSMRAQTG